MWQHRACLPSHCALCAARYTTPRALWHAPCILGKDSRILAVHPQVAQGNAVKLGQAGIKPSALYYLAESRALRKGAGAKCQLSSEKVLSSRWLSFRPALAFRLSSLRWRLPWPASRAVSQMAGHWSCGSSRRRSRRTTQPTACSRPSSHRTPDLPQAPPGCRLTGAERGRRMGTRCGHITIPLCVNVNAIALSYRPFVPQALADSPSTLPSPLPHRYLSC